MWGTGSTSSHFLPGREESARRARLSSRTAGAWLAALLLVGSHGAPATSETEAQDELEQVRERLEAVARDLASAHDDHDAHTRSLERSEKQAAGIVRDVRDLNDRLAAARQRLDATRDSLARTRSELAESRDQLARTVRASYRFARRDTFAMLLDLESPMMIDRILAYHRIIERTHSETIRGIADTVSRLETLEEKAAGEIAGIDALLAEKRHLLTELEGRRAARENAILSLVNRIRDKESLAARLRTDEHRLLELVEALRDSVTDAALQITDNQSFEELQGMLSWPVNGVQLAPYGELRDGSGLTRQGVLIAAATGQPVRTIHRGRVAYADWLRGFGLLLIIDHGDGFMSLYGHNETLIRDTGDWVESGEVIATVGDSGGYAEPSLYFEIRRAGKPVNPGWWCVDSASAALVSP